jgi:hypothetical protein
MFLHDHTDLQMVTLYATQVFCHSQQFPKGKNHIQSFCLSQQFPKGKNPIQSFVYSPVTWYILVLYGGYFVYIP